MASDDSGYFVFLFSGDRGRELDRPVFSSGSYLYRCVFRGLDVPRRLSLCVDSFDRLVAMADIPKHDGVSSRGALSFQFRGGMK